MIPVSISAISGVKYGWLLSDNMLLYPHKGYQLSYYYDQVDRPKTFDSRLKCDYRFLHDMKSACAWHHCNGWWKSVECAACHSTAEVWYGVVYGITVSNSYTTTPVANFDDASKTSLKQIWRPWDWRMNTHVTYARSFLEKSGRISSMMHGKVLHAAPNVVSQVVMRGCDANRCECHGLSSNDCVANVSFFGRNLTTQLCTSFHTLF